MPKKVTSSRKVVISYSDKYKIIDTFKNTYNIKSFVRLPMYLEVDIMLGYHERR